MNRQLEAPPTAVRPNASSTSRRYPVTPIALLAALGLLTCAEPGSNRLENGDTTNASDAVADSTGPSPTPDGEPIDATPGPDGQPAPDASAPTDALAPLSPDASATDAAALDANPSGTDTTSTADTTNTTNQSDPADATPPVDGAGGPGSSDAMPELDPDAETPPPFDPLEPGPITCGTMGFGAMSASFHDLSLSAGIAIFQAYDAELPPFGVLSIEIYDRTVTQPTVIDLQAHNYKDCQICVRIRTGCRGVDCPENWLAESGRLTLTSWEGHFTGYLDNVQLRAVDIDPETFVSTPRDAPGWCLDRFIFSVAWD